MTAVRGSAHGILALALLLTGAACGSGGGQPAQSSTTTPTPSASGPAPTQAPSLCHAPAAGSPASLHFSAEPALTVDAHATYTAALATNCGGITLALDAA